MTNGKAVVKISRETYNVIKDEATSSRRENMGAVYGRHEGNSYVIGNLERFSEEVSGRAEKLKLAHKITGTGGKMASPQVDNYVKQHSDVVGFYHSHPSGEPLLSPGDKKEFQKMDNYENLKEPAKLQIVTRMKGLGVLGKKGEPLFFVRGDDGKYRKAQVVVEG